MLRRGLKPAENSVPKMPIDQQRRSRALICSPHAWNGVLQLGAHRLARNLARRGWQVLFVTDPVSFTHLAGVPFRADLRLRFGNSFRGRQADPVDNVQFLQPFSLLPVNARLGAGSPFILKRWLDTTIPNLTACLRRGGWDRFDLAVFDGSVQAGLIEGLEIRRSVLRVFDRIEAMPGMTPALMAATRALARRVDLVAYTALSLAADVAKLEPSAVFPLLNGVDTTEFAEGRAEPPGLSSIPRPRAVYVGAIGPWFDAEALASAARQLPNVSFVLVGEAPPKLRRVFSGGQNLHFVGPVAWSEVPAWLSNCDVGLVPFGRGDHSRLVDGINPLKLHEYMAAGLPVVARRSEELMRLGSPAILYDEPDRLGTAILEALGRPDLAASGRSFAAANDWNLRVDKLLASLGLPLDQAIIQ